MDIAAAPRGIPAIAPPPWTLPRFLPRRAHPDDRRLTTAPHSAATSTICLCAATIIMVPSCDPACFVPSWSLRSAARRLCGHSGVHRSRSPAAPATTSTNAP